MTSPKKRILQVFLVVSLISGLSPAEPNKLEPTSSNVTTAPSSVNAPSAKLSQSSLVFASQVIGTKSAVRPLC